MKRWVHKTDLLKIRPAEGNEMVAPGQFSKPGDMIIVRALPDEDSLVTAKHFEDYVEVDVPDD